MRPVAIRFEAIVNPVLRRHRVPELMTGVMKLRKNDERHLGIRLPDYTLDQRRSQPRTFAACCRQLLQVALAFRRAGEESIRREWMCRRFSNKRSNLLGTRM